MWRPDVNLVSNKKQFSSCFRTKKLNGFENVLLKMEKQKTKFCDDLVKLTKKKQPVRLAGG
jgi:hypothetical protein